MLAYRSEGSGRHIRSRSAANQVECVPHEHQAAPKGSVLNNRTPAPAPCRQGRNAAMAVVTTRQLLESGVHFGHQTRRWNPKMKRFIFTERNGIYIIDLQQSLTYIDRAYAFIKDTVARGGQILLVGTKKQAQEAIAEQATRVGMPYVNQRWLGGMLTNFHTVIKRIQRLKELEGVDFASPGNDDAIRSISLLTRVVADAVAEGLMARSGGVQTGAEAEVEPMPDWERELLGASQEPSPAVAHDIPAADAAADAAVDVERQLDQPVNN